MSNIKISQLQSAGSLSGSEILPIVQAGDTKSTSINSIVGQVTLQKVTDNGNTTTNEIIVSGNNIIVSGNDVNIRQVSNIGLFIENQNIGGYTGIAVQNANTSPSGIVYLGNIYNDNPIRASLSANNLTNDRDYEFPDASGTIALTSDIGAGYLVYSALGYYSSGTFTVTTVLQNTLGATITWGNNGTLRTATASSSVFTSNKTVITATPIVSSSVSYNNIGARSSDTVVTLSCINNTTGTISYPFSQNIFVEIRVYP